MLLEKSLKINEDIREIADLTLSEMVKSGSFDADKKAIEMMALLIRTSRDLEEYLNEEAKVLDNICHKLEMLEDISNKLDKVLS